MRFKFQSSCYWSLVHTQHGAENSRSSVRRALRRALDACPDGYFIQAMEAASGVWGAWYAGTFGAAHNGEDDVQFVVDFAHGRRQSSHRASLRDCRRIRLLRVYVEVSPNKLSRMRDRSVHYWKFATDVRGNRGGHVRNFVTHHQRMHRSAVACPLMNNVRLPSHISSLH